MGESNVSSQYQKLPPGWDCKLDQATGNCYYINYFTKAMQLEDPRIRYKQLQNERCSTESIPLQPLHGSPYHVYPSNNLPAMRAFQAGTNHHANLSWQNMSSSPLLSSRGNLEMSPTPFPKLAVTNTPRLGNMSRRSTIQETSFSNQIDTDAVVNKIQNMFPTASENHIRLLLKRYYNREAVVISALQVEKHPVTMPGPFVTPPAQRHLFHSNSAFQMTPPSRRLDIEHSVGYSVFGAGSGTSRTASPLPRGRFGSVISMNSSGRGGVNGAASTAAGCGFVGLNRTVGTSASIFGNSAAPSSVLFHGSPRFGEQWRSSPKPHSSPKMKLRYMKTIFPKADEMLLLDVLANSDNNVQKASQTLISMGYTKRDYAPPKPPHRPGLGVEALNDELQRRKSVDEQTIPLRPKECTQQEKEGMQQRLKEKYPKIAELIIIMALESVNYSEDRAIQILQIVQNEEDATRSKNAASLKAGLLPSTLECNELDDVVCSTSATGGEGAENIITVVVEENQLPNGNSSTNSNSTLNKTDKCMLEENDQKPTTIIKNTTLTTTQTTSTLSTSASSSLSLLKNSQMMKKRAFPSINLTTPTTATTQIILSNSPIYAENEATPINLLPSSTKTEIGQISSKKAEQINIDEPKIATTNVYQNAKKRIHKTLSPQSQSPTSSVSTPSSKSFETITIKSMLARLNNSTVKRLNISSSIEASANSYGTASLLEKLKLSSRSRDKFDTLKYSQRGSHDDEKDSIQHQEFKTIIGRIATMGPNNELSKGPDESLLLADYVTWNGANPDISTGHKNQANGPDTSLLSERSYMARGRNVELCKGPKAGLVKGSIYAQLTATNANSITNSKCANIKCN